MTVLLIMLIVGFAVAAAIALIRGLGSFLHDSKLIREHETLPRKPFGEQQNRMMAQRVLFQGIAILMVAALGVLAGRN